MVPGCGHVSYAALSGAVVGGKLDAKGEDGDRASPRAAEVEGVAHADKFEAAGLM